MLQCTLARYFSDITTIKMRKISLLFLLAIAVTVVFSQEERLLLTHSYPENRNFNKVELNCRFNSTVLAEEPRFLRNRTTDIMDIHYDGERGSVIFMFDQDGEGLFTCALGTSMLSNPITLAGMRNSYYALSCMGAERR